MQPTPKATPEDVEHVVARDFPPQERQTVFAMLGEYGRQSWQREQDRVRLAVLKLADSNLAQLRQNLDIALRDYRDVLSYAEYPLYSRKVHPGPDLPRDEIRRIVQVDWDQYQVWLNRSEDEPKDGEGR